MNELQQQINDLVLGKHKQWHLEALKTHELRDNGWDWLHDQHWEFVAGFDSYGDALDAMKSAEKTIAEGRPYGANQYDLRISERVGGRA